MANDRRVGNLLVQMRAELGGLRTDVKEMERTFNNSFNIITSGARQLGNALSLGLSVGTLIAFGKGLIDLGGRLDDLARQTGISGSTLSGLKSTLEENGSTVEAFALGVFNLQKNIGQITTETDPAAKAIKALGLNLNDLRNSGTEDFLEKVLNALAKIENPIQRNALGAALLGKAYRELGPAVEALAGKFGLLKNSGLTEAQIKRLDEFGDAWTRFKNKLQIGAIQGIDVAIANLQKLGDAMGTVASVQRRLQAGAATGGAAGLLPAQKPPGFNPQDADNIKKSTDALRQFNDALEKQLTTLQSRRLALGGGEQAALGFQLDEQFKAFRDKMTADKLPIPKGLEESFNRLKTAILGANTELRQTTELLDRIGKDEADVRELAQAFESGSLAPFKAEDAMTLQRMDEAAARAAQDFDDMAEATRAWAEIGLEAFRVGDNLTKKLQDIDREAELVGPSFDALSAKIEAYKRAILELPAGAPEIAELRAQLEGLRSQQGIFDLLASSAGQLASAIGRGGDALQNFGATALQVLTQVIAKIIEMQLAFSFSGGTSGSNLLGSIFGSILRAFGGAAAGAGGGGGAGLVWTAEGFNGVVRRPTTFVAGEAGAEHVQVTPLSRMGGGGFGNVYNIDARGAQRGVSAEIMRAIHVSENRAVNRSVAEVKNERGRSHSFARAFSR